MMEFIFAGQNLPFTVALGVMLVIAVLEGITTVLGAGLSDVLDALIPEFDLDADFDVDMDSPDFDAPGALTKLFGWLHIGRVPVLMLLIIFLTAFGLLGLGIQSLAQDMFGILLPGLLSAGATFFLALPVVRLCGGILGKIMPQDETDAVSEKSFIGRIAVITLGKAAKGNPTQAKLRDEHGQTHYVMVEPDMAEDEFEMGSSIVLVSQQGAVFKAIHNTSAALVEE